MRSAVVIGVLCAIGLLLRMFLPVAVGLSDQGDGHPLLCELGLRDEVPWGASQSDYVYFHWNPYHYYGESCGANGTGQPFYSSHLALLRIAGWLTPLLDMPSGLDLRALAVLCCVIAGFAIGWLVAELRGPVLGRIVVGLLVGLLVADSGIAVYFASPYVETAGLLGVLLLCPAMVRLVRERRYALGALCGVFAIAGFTLTSQLRMIGLLPVLLIMLLARPFSESIGEPATSRIRRLAAWFGRRVPTLIAAIGLMALSVAYLSAQPPRFAELNAYNQIFGTILPDSPDRAADLRWFGLDPALARGSGSNVLSPNSVAGDPAMHDFREKVTTPRVIGFYLTHPGQMSGLIWHGLIGASAYRLTPYLADYGPDSGQPPHSQDHRLEVFSWMYSMIHGGPLLLLLLWIGALIFFGVLSRRGSPPAVLGLVLVTGAIVQFAVVMTTGGATELTKHMIVVDFASALCFPVAIAAVLGRARRVVDAHEPPDDPAEKFGTPRRRAAHGPDESAAAETMVMGVIKPDKTMDWPTEPIVPAELAAPSEPVTPSESVAPAEPVRRTGVLEEDPADD